MRIGIHTLFCPENKKMGGNTYLSELSRVFSRNGLSHDFTFFVRSRNSMTKIMGLNAGSSHSHIQIVNEWRPGSKLNRAIRKFFRMSGVGPDFRQGIRNGRWKMDVIHYPYLRLEPECPAPAVITIFDLAHEIHPEFFPGKAYEEKKEQFNLGIKLAKQIVVPSEFTKKNLLRYYPEAENRITITPLGVDHDRFRPMDEKQAVSQMKPYAVPEGAVVYPAGFWPHKNHRRLVEAWKILKDRHHLFVPLVFTGYGVQDGGEDAVSLRKTIERFGMEKEISIIPPLPDEVMPAFYNMARLVVFPSLTEGFGLSVLEASACGIPVICSDAGALPEVMEDAALYIDPSDPEALAEACFEALSDFDLHEGLRKRGLGRAKEFSWQKTAEATVGVYEKIYQRNLKAA